MSVSGALMIAMAIGPAPFLPEAAAGWQAEGPASTYDAETIFQYIDGLGEVYLAYDMTACHARRYRGPAGEGDIVADVFDMPTSGDAYGLYTHSREGTVVDVGQDASFGYGSLLFWKGRRFVSVQAEVQSEGARDAAMAIGRAVAEATPEEGDRPPLVARLPSPGLDPQSVVYLHHPQILDAHARLGPGNLLGVGRSTPAVMGRYRRGDATVEMVLVEYPDEEAAAAARVAFGDRFSTTGTPVRREDGWYGVTAVAGPGHLSAFVIRATSREAARELLSELSGGE
jgi:hypothetical protein